MENILVIDDDEKILELVQEVLKNEHYIVETRSYVDNTNIGEFEGFDLILLDIMLPFLDGYEIAVTGKQTDSKESFTETE